MHEAKRELVIVNQRGLHARASAKFVGAVAQLPGDVSVTIAKGDNHAAGGSILGLMMLGAAKGDTIVLTVSGPDADRVIEPLAAMIGDGFGEE
ncbi:HPr family phosphocarrier protein [Pontixanthobacter sp.]|uniref:HPr family phosphocarrier protein n=1 Tax=Pontixanthobacter sp. TaxID=2792078 RepID=UPI003C7BC541